MWNELCEAWRCVLGNFDTAAICERRQASRSGLGVLLMCAGTPVAFVKLRPDDPSLEVELRVLGILDEVSGRSFSSPVPLGGGRSGDWSWAAFSPMPALPHQPARNARVTRILDEVQEALAPVLDRVGAPPHWRPMHGDFALWNLRSHGHGDRPWLIDWEECAWAPPGADLVYFDATAASLGGPAPVHRDPEAVEFWQERVRRRPLADVDRRLTVSLTEVLDAMKAP